MRSDQAAPAPLAGLFATLDREDAPPAIGEALPPLAHWLYFLPAERRSQIGNDGRGGAFLPPIELAGRVCAARRVRFHRPLRVGAAISRISRIVDIAEAQGRGDPRVFVLVRHEIADADGVALSEDQRVAFQRRSPAAPERRRRARREPVWSRRVRIDEVTLFRYSALTFDAHRIHYDRRYAATVEGCPGLVVQDGLVANLLIDLLRRHAPTARILSCDFRLVRPLFDIEPFSLCGRPAAGRTAESLG